MKILSRRDIAYAIITGLTTGIIATLVLTFLRQTLPFGVSPGWLIPLVPILWVVGVQLGYFLGGWFGFFNQFGKFVAIGFTNFAVDAGVLNLLLSLTHAAEGPLFAVQKSISFILAVIHSYFWNRRWSFASSHESHPAEFARFVAVNLAAIAINVGTATLVVSILPRPATFTPEVWANLGAVAGSAVALIFSFVGFRLVVFRRT